MKGTVLCQRSDSGREKPGLTCGVKLLRFVALVLIAGSTVAPVSAARVDETSLATLDADLVRRIPYRYHQLPVSFEANQGQTHSDVRFLGRLRGYTVLFTSNEVIMVLNGGATPAGTEQLADRPERLQGSSRRSVLRMRLANASRTVLLEGDTKLQGKSNYFIGQNPDNWHTDVPHYAGVIYRDIYPGIDLFFFGERGRLKYEFRIAPGGDPGHIQLQFRGHSKIRIGDGGNLFVETPAGVVSHSAPFIYQEMNGRREKVGGYFRSRSEEEVGFELSGYDPDRPLVIDPELIFSSYLGGSGRESATGLKVDESGNIYLTALTEASDFPLQDPFQDSVAGDLDAVVVKLNSAGDELVYATYLGGSANEGGHGIGVDATGSAYITGTTSSTDFPLMNPLQEAHGGDTDGFVTKLSPEGNALIYSTFYGGTSGEGPCALALDSAGNAYITGSTDGGTLPLVNPFQSQAGEFFVGFVAKISASGDRLIFSSFLGGHQGSVAHGIAVAEDQSVFIVGATATEGLATPGAFQATLGSQDCCDAFLLKLNPDGSRRFFSYLGGADFDIGRGVAVDPNGLPVLTGETRSTDFPFVGGLQSIVRAPEGHFGPDDAFVARFSSDGAQLLNSIAFGGSEDEEVRGIAISDQGDIAITGRTVSLDLPLFEPIQEVLAGGADIFVARFSTDLSNLLFATYLGGSGSDRGTSIALDTAGNILVAGNTDSEDFPTRNALQPALSSGGSDLFFLKIGDAPLQGGDSDSDGVDDSIEDAAPNGGDGNNDGTADSEQAHVASLPNAVTGEYVTLVSAQGTMLVSVEAVENPSPMSLPPGVVFPMGLFQFSVQGLAPGVATTVELLLPSGLEIDSYYKFGPTPENGTPHWYDFVWDDLTGVEVSEGKLDLHFIDGSRGDDDLSANGTVIEPGGPAQILDSFFFPQFADGLHCQHPDSFHPGPGQCRGRQCRADRLFLLTGWRTHGTDPGRPGHRLQL